MKMQKVKQCNFDVEMETEGSIFEECYYCSKELLQIEDIFVSIKSDRYICGECSKRMDIEVVICMDY